MPASGVGVDETEICGSRGRRIQKRAPRGSLKKNPKRRSFTVARRRKFLDHVAASCNIKGACRSAGVSNSTVHAWLRKDAQFRADVDEALAQGCVEVRAELIRQTKRSLAVLQSCERNGGRRPGDIKPQRTDIEQVRARLEKTMRGLGLLPDEGCEA
jgi:hypothetical protein